MKIIGPVRKKTRLRAVHFIVFFISLLGLQLIYCFYLMLKVGLLHGSKTLRAQLPLQCFLSSIVTVLLPMAVLFLYHRTRSKRVLVISLLVFFLLLGLSCVYFTPGAGARLVDNKGNPLAGAYVFYSRHVHFLFSDWGYVRFTRTGKHGDFTVPAQIHINLPFEYSFGFQKPGPVKLPVKIYVPELYNFCSIGDTYTWRYKKESGDILSVDTSTTPVIITPRDFRQIPRKCFHTLNRLVFHSSLPGINQSKRYKQELLSIIKKKYGQFASQYGSGPQKSDDISKKRVDSEEAKIKRKNVRSLLESTEHGRTLKEEIARLERQLAGTPEEEKQTDLKGQPLVPASAAESGWPTYGATPGHTRYIDGRAIHSPILVKDFKHKIRSREVLFCDINKDGIQDLVICGLMNKGGWLDVAAIDGRTRKIIWKLECRAIFFSFPITDKGVLYFASREKKFQGLYAVDLSSGRLLWKYKPNDVGGSRFLSSPAADNECVYYGSETREKTGKNMYRYGSHIFALDKKNGELRWKLKTDAWVPESPLIIADKLYFFEKERLGLSSYITCVDLKTRKILWKFQTDHDKYAVPPSLVGAGDVLLCPYSTFLYALDTKNGQLKWKYKTPFRMVSSAAVKDNVVCFNSGGIYALDITTGGLKWKFAVKSRFSTSPCIVGDVVYAGGVEGYVYALRLENGQKLWEYKIGGFITAISTVGTVIAVITGSKELYFLVTS